MRGKVAEKSRANLSRGRVRARTRVWARLRVRLTGLLAEKSRANLAKGRVGARARVWARLRVRLRAPRGKEPCEPG